MLPLPLKLNVLTLTASWHCAVGALPAFAVGGTFTVNVAAPLVAGVQPALVKTAWNWYPFKPVTSDIFKVVLVTPEFNVALVTPE